MTTLRLALAQIDPTIGAFTDNVGRITARIRAAQALGADIVVFPELALTGYPPEDLLHRPSFVRAAAVALADVAAGVPDELLVVLGTVAGTAELHNAAALLCGGRVVDTYHKVHLPNYGVFDELRYFAPGQRIPVYEVRGVPVAVTICEDLWQPAGPWVDALYRGRARLILNLSASPYHHGKIAQREGLFAARALENHVPVAFCNLVGAQDELIFDGTSAVFGPTGQVRARAPSFREHLLVVDVDDDHTVGALYRARPATVERASELRLETVAVPLAGPARADRLAIAQDLTPHAAPEAELYDALVLGIADYCRKNGFDGVVVGLSGGIDSALTAALAVAALGPARVLGVTMPGPFSSAETLADALLLAQNLGIGCETVPIGALYDAYRATLAGAFGDRPADVTEENLQARVRGALVMAFANKFGRIVLATGNKSEISTGYCTLYGDMVGGFSPLKDVYKTAVFSLARHANRRAGRAVIPQTTIDRPPTAELRANQKDEDALGRYDALDRVLHAYLEEERTPADIARIHELPIDFVLATIRRIEASEYKRRQGAPGIKVTARAFGKDRRFPITHHFRELR